MCSLRVTTARSEKRIRAQSASQAGGSVLFHLGSLQLPAQADSIAASECVHDANDRARPGMT